MMDQTHWLSLMQALGFKPNLGTCDALLKEHAGRHRHYHTQEHISACLRHLDTVREKTNHPNEIALAFWFHDAVYKAFSATNERDSADWAIEFLEENRANQDMIDRVEALIMATVHNPGPLSGDMAIMVDIDLAILGASQQVYDQYEINIRKEYRRVPGFIFRKKRKALLRAFLDQDRLYHTDHFHDLWNGQALKNLSRAIAAL